jgi:hypothetical protein
LKHCLLDLRQVLFGDLCVGRELEVVVEAGLDRRPDRHLGARVQIHHRLGHHVGGVVADQFQRLGIAVGEDRDLGTRRRQRRAEVAQLAIDPDRQRRLGQTGADRRGGVGAGRARRKLQHLAIGQGDTQFLRCGLHRAIVPTAGAP